MKVKHGLTGIGSLIDGEAIPALGNALFGGDGVGGGEHGGEHLAVCGRELCRACDVLVGDDEDVDRRLRVDVPKRSDYIVTINDLAWYFVADDFAE